MQSGRARNIVRLVRPMFRETIVQNNGKNLSRSIYCLFSILFNLVFFFLKTTHRSRLSSYGLVTVERQHATSGQFGRALSVIRSRASVSNERSTERNFGTFGNWTVSRLSRRVCLSYTGELSYIARPDGLVSSRTDHARVTLRQDRRQQETAGS